MKPLVVIAGAIHPDGMKQLEPEARVIVTDQVTEEGMIEVAREAEGILFRIRPDCTRALMTACSRLKVIGRHGVGLDTVDLKAATDLGIAVVHAPGSNSDSVAEHALMLILACAKQTLDVDRMTRKAEWRRPPKGNMELKGKTLGIVGVGNIGRRMARLGHALGMRVIGYDKYVPDEEVRARGAEPLPDLYSVLSEADVVTCHTPHTPETHHMIDGKAVAKMKDGVIFVNTAGLRRQPAAEPAQCRRQLAHGGGHGGDRTRDGHAGDGRDAAGAPGRKAARARQSRPLAQARASPVMLGKLWFWPKLAHLR